MIHKSVFFCLFFWSARGVFGDEVKSVSVMEGHSVTLNTNVTDVQERDHILWMFGPQGTRIAEIYKKNIDMFDSIKIFGNRLKLDSQTGSLTITNIINSGLYKLLIISDRGNSDKTFNVTAYAPLPVPVISRINNSSNCSSQRISERSSSSSCVFVCSVLNVSHVTLSWYKGNSLLSNISVSDLNIRLSLPLEVEYQDTNTYSCVLNNPITNHTTHLNITQLCQPCSDISSIVAGCVGLLVIGVLIGVCVFCCFYKKKTKTNQGNKAEVPPVEMQLMSDRQ